MVCQMDSRKEIVCGLPKFLVFAFNCHRADHRVSDALAFSRRPDVPGRGEDFAGVEFRHSACGASAAPPTSFISDYRLDSISAAARRGVRARGIYMTFYARGGFRLYDTMGPAAIARGL